MQVLAALNILLVGLWAGMYLFTTLVVSPAFVLQFPDLAERSRHRRAVGRVYARVNGVLTALLVAALLALGFVGGWSLALGAELLLLAVIGALVAGHVRRAETDLPPTWLTQATLLAVTLLCAAALASRL